MSKQRIYYPRTTYSQRQLLFQVWEETQNVSEACRQARIGKSTFYYWKPRFEAGGYEALKEVKKPGPSKGMWVAEEIQEKVAAMKKAHPEWGKQRIADELAKGNSWVPLVSVNTVRRILQEKGLWEEVVEAAEKKDSSQQSVRRRNQAKASM
jgi:transposase